MKQNIIDLSMFHGDPDFFIILNKQKANPSFNNKISTQQKIPKLWIPFKVCQMGFPSSYLVHTGISTTANKMSKTILMATAASDYNKPNNLQFVAQVDYTFVAIRNRQRR